MTTAPSDPTLPAVLGSIGPLYLTVKSVPLLGQTVMATMLATTNGAAVYAIGKLFQKPFESGGVFLSDRSSVLRRFLDEKHREGKTVVPTYLGTSTP